MIENIRKYTGLMIVVFVVLFVSFLLLDTSTVQSVGGGGAVLRVDGRSYTDREMRRIGQNGFELTQALSQGNFSVFQFRIAATMNATDESGEIEQFFITRLMIRSAAEEFGLQPSEAEISSFIRSHAMFAGPDGDFDSQAYSAFIERRIGRFGMTEADVRSLVADILVFEKLKTVVGAGLAPVRDSISRSDAFQNQRITGSLVHLELAPFEDAVDVTDEGVRELWEIRQDVFRTDPRRRFTYVHVVPDLPADISPEEEELPPLTFEDLSLTEEQREARELEFQAQRAAERAEKRRTVQQETDRLVEQFFDELILSEGSDFEALAEQLGFEVKTTDFFAMNEPPTELAVALRQSSRRSTAAQELFNIVISPDPFSKISPPLAVGDGAWIVARLDEIEDSRVMTFEEAEEEAREMFLREQADAAMKDAAEAAIEKINEAMAEGQSFAEAARAAGFDEVHRFENITSAHMPDPTSEPQSLFEASRTVTPGTVAEVIVESDRAFILHVENRELVREEDLEERVDDQFAMTTDNNETTAIIAWLESRTRAADVQRLGRR